MYKLGIVAVGIFLFLFGILSKYEDRAIVRNMDFSATVRLQERIDGSSHLRFSSAVGNIMEGATFFASPEFTVFVTLMVTGFMLYDRNRKRWHVWAFSIPLALILLVAAEIYGKSIVHHPAPPFSMIKHPTTIFPADYINEQFSYPSGHAARAMFLMFITVLMIYIRKNLTRSGMMISVAIGLIYVSVVSISRIYLGHHWLSDVVGGLLLGGGLSGICVYVLLKFRT